MKVYLAGAVTGMPDPEIFDWRDMCTAEFKASGIEVADPARLMMAPDSGRQWEEKNHDYKEIVRADMSLIRECDLLLANCTYPSWGTAMEIFHAWMCAKPVCIFRTAKRHNFPFGGGRPTPEPWSAFLLYHSHAQFPTREEAVSWCAGKLVGIDNK